VVRLVDFERRRAGKRVGHIACRGQHTHDFGRRVGQDSIAAEETVAGRIFARRSAGPVRRTHVPQAIGRYPHHVLLDTVTQDVPRRESSYIIAAKNVVRKKERAQKKKKF